jgi:hypothetical protein
MSANAEAKPATTPIPAAPRLPSRSLEGFAIPAATSEEAWKFCQKIAESELVPKALRGKPADIYVAAVMGNQLGLPFFSAIQGIASINGKPSIYGDLMLAVCQSHPDFQDIEESCDGKTAVCIVTRKGRKPYTGQFTMDEAKAAGLVDRNPVWKTYPRRMLTMRARSYALRAVFADRLAGFHTIEEMQDAEVLSVQDEAPQTVVPDAKPAKIRGEAAAPAIEAPAPQEESAPEPEPEAPAEAKEPPPTATQATATEFAKRVIKDLGDELAGDIIGKALAGVGAGTVKQLQPAQCGPFLAKLTELYDVARGAA